MDLLPLSQDVHMHRFIGGVHLGGIFLAAIALAVPWRWTVSRGNMLYIVGALALTLFILSPLYVERNTFLSDKAVVEGENQRALNAEQDDLNDIIKTLKELPPGRVYAGMTDESPTPEAGERWGRRYQIGGLTVSDLLVAAGLDVLSSSLHDYSLSASPENSFDETRPEQYNLFNIRYVVQPENVQVPSFMKPIKNIGRHQLYQVETTGYFDLGGSGLLFTGRKAMFRLGCGIFDYSEVGWLNAFLIFPLVLVVF